MKAAGRRLNDVTPSDVLLLDWDGEPMEGSGQRHGEWPIHTEVMLARPDVNATVHTHPPHAVALSASGEPLRPVAHAATAFVPPDVPRFDDFTGVILARGEAQGLIDALGDSPAVLLVNHGILTVGDTVGRAVMYALLLEQACHFQLLAQSYGGVRHWTSDEEALKKRKSVANARVLAIQYAGELSRLDQ